MLKSVVYLAKPHDKARNHEIPVDAIEKATGKRNNSELDGKECLLEIFIKSKAAKVKVVPPIVLTPSSGGEIYVGQKVCPEFPEHFSISDYLIVRLTVLA
jgi:hypothetical protein